MYDFFAKLLMYDFFVKLLNMSLAASIIVLVIVVLRLLLKKAPKNIICFLWGLVALRLILPFSIQSNLSAFNMMPSSAGTQGQIEYFQYNGKTEKPKVEFSVPALVNDNASPDSMTVGEHTSDLYLPTVISIWLAGVCVMFLYAIGSYLYLRKKVAASIPRHDGLKMSDDISTPFILGILKPVIYIPSGMDEKTLNHVIAHEEAHIKRRDHWWKPLGYCLLTVYWFNPIIWLAYVLLCRDIEMACDEKVIRELDNNDKAAYSQALLNCSFPRRRITACPLAFGEVGVKERVRSVLNYKKPAFWIIAVAVVACIVVGVCFLTNPSDKSLSGKLGVSMDMAVAEYNHSTHSDGNFIATNYDVLRITEEKGKTTVYAWVYYAEYSFDGTDVKMESASHIPTAVTFDTSADDSDSSTYDVIEYWIPGDGSDYAKDIREKFPLAIQAKAFDTSGAAKQKEKCLKAAREYYQIPDEVAAEEATPSSISFDSYSAVEVLYMRHDINYSMITQKNIPVYTVTEDMKLMSKGEYSPENEWTSLGTLTDIELTKENFDELFLGKWLPLEDGAYYRKNNAHAWYVIYQQDILYYVLFQKNGEVLLANGYYDYLEKNDSHSDDSSIKLLYRLGTDIFEDTDIENDAKGSIQVSNEADRIDNGELCVLPLAPSEYHDLTKDGSLEITEVIKDDEILVFPQTMSTNKEQIAVTNKSDVDITAYLYVSDDDFNKAIREVIISENETKTFTGLTSRFNYRIGVSVDASAQIDLIITN